jgi:hypothetical protein
MSVLFRSLTGKPYPLSITPSTTVRDARLHLSDLLAIPFSELLLILHGSILSDSATFSSLPLGPDDFIVAHMPKLLSKRLRYSIPVAPIVIPPVGADRKPLPEMMEGDVDYALPIVRRDFSLMEAQEIEARVDVVMDRVGLDQGDQSRGYVLRLLETCRFDVDATVACYLEKVFNEARNKAERKVEAPAAEPEEDYTEALAALDLREGRRYVTWFTNPQKGALVRLCQEFPRVPAWEVIQIYIFSDRIYDTARENLTHA